MSHDVALRTILRQAYSGELTAALAYRGHWVSLRSESEIADIQRIEREEWHHRRRLGGMLRELGDGPDRVLDLRMGFLGVVILLGCNMVGWFIPMYFAGRLESQNDQAYEQAALHAQALGLENLRQDLKDFAQLERDHERYFLDKVAGHPALPFWRRWFGWGPEASTGVTGFGTGSTGKERQDLQD